MDNSKLRRFITANGLSIAAVAREIGLDRSTISKIVSGDYPSAEDKVEEIIDELRARGFTKEPIAGQFAVDDTVMVSTGNVSRFKALCDDLASPESSLSSSIGMVLGYAGRGKTHTSRWYVAQNRNVCRVQFMEGFSQVKLLREIAFELAGMRPTSFERCLAVIEEATSIVRKLVLIDEADKMPVKFIEMIRGLNERCNLPFVLIGEEALKPKIDNVPRLKSRIRKPIVLFTAVDVVDVRAFYQMSTGLVLSVDVAAKLCKRADGDFRTVVNEAMALIKILNASDLTEINDEMLRGL